MYLETQTEQRLGLPGSCAEACNGRWLQHKLVTGWSASLSTGTGFRGVLAYSCGTCHQCPPWEHSRCPDPQPCPYQPVLPQIMHVFDPCIICALPVEGHVHQVVCSPRRRCLSWLQQPAPVPGSALGAQGCIDQPWVHLPLPPCMRARLSL